jgi:N-methylhydantoinase A
VVDETARWRVGVDVGGTFTDFAVFDERAGALLVEKVPTTPRNPAEGIIAGLRRLAEQDVDTAAIISFVHGSTITTNALIELKGARVGLLLTKGFRAVPEVQSQRRLGPVYDLFYRRPQPLAPVELTLEVPERVDARGNVVRPLDEAAVEAAVRRLLDEGVEAIAVCYLFSYANPDHERRTREIIQRLAPGLFISLSSEILPRIREWPRMSSTLMNAYLEPALVRYVESLNDELRREGIATRQLFVMQSNGGVMPFSAAIQGGKTIHTLLSGPAGGVKAGAYFAMLQGYSNIITMDMGGTSCDIAFIQHGAPLEVTEGMIDRRDIYVPMLDVTAIGAGGGTLAYLDSAGHLNVGPQSAGADPGPVAYRHGASQPTVTDADLLLGYLNPDYFLGGRLPLDRSAAEAALAEKIGQPLGTSAVEAAQGIVRIVDVRMADQVRVLASMKALLLRDFVLVAGGGAGAVHASAVAEELGISRVVLPPHPGAFSAIGLLCSDVIHDYVQSNLRPLASTPVEHLNGLFSALEQQAAADLESEGLGEADRTYIRELDLRYAGQGFEIRVPVPGRELSAGSLATVAERYHALHEQLRGHRADEEPIETVSYRVRVVVEVPKAQLARASGRPEPEPPAMALKGTRQVYFDDPEHPLETPIYQRDHLRFGNQLHGPAIVEQIDSTSVIRPGWTARVDEFSNLIAEREVQ